MNTISTKEDAKLFINHFIDHTAEFLNQLNYQHIYSQNLEERSSNLKYEKENFDKKIEEISLNLKTHLLSTVEKSSGEELNKKSIKNLSQELKKARKEIITFVQTMNQKTFDQLALSQSKGDIKTATLVKKLQAGGLSAKMIKLLGHTFKINQKCMDAFSAFNKINNQWINCGSKKNLPVIDKNQLCLIDQDRLKEFQNYQTGQPLLAQRAGVIGINGIYRIQTLFSKEEIKKQLNSYYAQRVSETPRQKILEKIPCVHPSHSNHLEVEFESIPFNQEFDVHLNENVFGSIAGTKGISSNNRQEAHLVNGWLSTAKNDKGEVIYSANRHAILSDKLEKDLLLRRANSFKAALELVKAILLEELALQGLSLEDVAHSKQVISLNVNSVSLITPDALRYFLNGHLSEKQMLKDQMTAWSDVEQVTTLMIGDKEVKIKLEVAKFNYGVNAGAVGKLKFAPGLKFGLNEQYTYNQKALQQLQVHYHAFLDQLNDVEKEGQELGALNALHQDIQTLSTHQSAYLKGKNQYELAAKIVNFYNLMNRTVKNVNDLRRENGFPSMLSGFHSCFNCMSGKDRTGIADGMAKAFAILYDRNGKFPSHQELLQDQNIREQLTAILYPILLKSGGLQITQLNTGVAGFKVDEEARLCGISVDEFARLQGLSRLISA